MYTRRLQRLAYAVTAAVLLTSLNATLAASQTSRPRIEAALDNITTLNRPGQEGYATIWDGDKYVQCRRLADHNLRCESAGTLMQSSLERVLTAERVARLSALGWRLDPCFGNYVQVFSADAASSLVADKIIQALDEAYGANTAELEVQSTWVPSEPCRRATGRAKI
jgi:hypothetical protein